VYADIVPAIHDALAFSAGLDTVAWVMFAVGLAVGIAAFSAEMGEVVTRFTLVDVAAVGLLGIAVGGVRMAEDGAERVLADSGRLSPIASLVAEFGFQLPGATLAGYTTSFDVHVDGGVFGDIFVYGPDKTWTIPELAEGEPTPPTPVLWYRAYAWTGAGWVADSTPMAQTTLAPNYPALLVVPGSTPATLLMDALEHVGGSANLLLRVGELDPMIGRETAFSEARYLPISVADGVDFEHELFVHSAKREIYWGPARYFGAGSEERRTIHRLDAAIENTGATAVRMSVSDKTSVDHFIGTCLASRFNAAPEPELDEDEEAPVEREDILPCTIVNQSIDDLVTGAVDAVGMPEAENVRMQVDVEEPMPAAISDVMAREIAAFGWCAEMVQDDMGLDRKITGRLAGQFEVDERGRAGYIEWDDRRVIDIYDMRRCVRERINRMRFPEWEMPPVPEPEDPEAEVEEIPAPVVKFTLTYR